MTRAQFLNRLYRRLGGLTQEQAEQHLTYYAEMLADRIEEGMTEEEAVASMEDIETIAQRILQEEGVSGGEAKPPQYPDLPKAERTAETARTPERPKRDWRKPAQVALWVLAILVAGGAIFNFISSRKDRPADRGMGTETLEALEAPEAPEVPDSIEMGGIHVGPDGIYVGDGEHSVSVGPDGIHLNGEWDDDWDEWESWDDPGEAGAYEYAGGTYEVAKTIREIEIDWVSGVVDIQPGDSGAITFREEATGALTDETSLVWKTDDDKLEIQFCRREWTAGNRNCPAKRLTVYVPQGLLEELEINTTSATVTVTGLCLHELKVDTTSGDVSLSGVEADSFEADTTSGSVTGSLQAWEVGADTVSGDVVLHVSGASEIESDTISGEVQLYLDKNAGFTMEFDTVSGELLADDFQVSVRNNRYVCGDGSCEIKVGTVSGDLALRAD